MELKIVKQDTVYETVHKFITDSSKKISDYEEMIEVVLEMVKNGYCFLMDRDILRDALETLTFMYEPNDDMNRDRLILQLVDVDEDEDDDGGDMGMDMIKNLGKMMGMPDGGDSDGGESDGSEDEEKEPVVSEEKEPVVSEEKSGEIPDEGTPVVETPDEEKESVVSEEKDAEKEPVVSEEKEDCTHIGSHGSEGNTPTSPEENTSTDQ